MLSMCGSPISAIGDLGFKMPAQTLLSIDDNPQILELIRKVATGMGMTAEGVTTPGAFMTSFVRLQPDIITLDMCMPDIDGIELLRWLGDVGAATRIVILSGAHPTYAEMARRLAEAAGLRDVAILRKPFRTAELRDVLLAPPLAPLPQRTGTDQVLSST